MRRLCAVVVLMAVFAAACTGGDGSPPAPEPSPEASTPTPTPTSAPVAADVVGTWTESGDPPTTPPGSGSDVMLELNADGQGTGYDGCNGGGGPWSLEGDTVVLTEWFMTLRGCPPAVRTASFGPAAPVKVVDDTLVVPASDGGDPFVLHRVKD